MNDIDLWVEAEDFTETPENEVIGGELFKLYDRAFNNHYEDENLQVIVDTYTWDIYSEILDGVPFEKSLKNHITIWKAHLEGRY